MADQKIAVTAQKKTQQQNYEYNPLGVDANKPAS